MDEQELVPGLAFANQHELSKKEVVTLLGFLKGPMTTADAARNLFTNKVTLHHIIIRLKHKGLLVQTIRNPKTQEITYGFNGVRKNELRKPKPDPRPQCAETGTTETGLSGQVTGQTSGTDEFGNIKPKKPTPPREITDESFFVE